MSNLRNPKGNEKPRSSWNRIDLDLEEIRRLYLGGMSENQVAKLFSTQRNVIRTRLLEMGVEIRSQSEAEKLKWSRMNDSQRINQVRNAHLAVKDKPFSEDRLRRHAIGKQRTGCRIGMGEEKIFKFLSDAGFKDISRQFAFDGYNFDFLVGSIAVELHRKASDPLRCMSDFKKIKDIISSGLVIIYLCVKDIHHLRIEALNELVRMLNFFRKNPPAHGQYWMIRSYRNTYSGFIRDFQDVASIESLVPSFNPPRERKR